MPNWRKVITSGSDAILRSVTIDNNVVASSFTGSLLGTSSYAITASFALNGGGGNTFINGQSATSSFTNLATWSFAHNLNTSVLVVQAYDSNNYQLLPGSIFLSGSNNAIISFPITQSGYAVATYGGTSTTSSYALTYNTSIPNTWAAGQAGQPVTTSYSATMSLNMASGNNFDMVLTGSTTLLAAPINPRAGQSGVIDSWQDITGSRALVYDWPWQFPNGTAPTLSTIPLTKDELVYYTSRYSTASVSMTSGSNIIISSGSSLISGNIIQFSGSLIPSPLATNTKYWITALDVNSYKVSSTFNNATGSVYITPTNSGSGWATNYEITLTINKAIA